MEESNRYSIQCLSPRLNIEILQGTEKADIKVMIVNTSNEKFINFKYQFDLFTNDFITDEIIKEKLKRNNFDFNKAFESLYE